MPAYQSNPFSPAAPVAFVTLRNPESGAIKTDVAMLLDTGADVTLLPEIVARELGILPVSGKRYELVGFHGTTSSSTAVRAEMAFLNYTFRGQFLLIDQEWGIVGRNVLNALAVLFDGPRQVWEERK